MVSRPAGFVLLLLSLFGLAACRHSPITPLSAAPTVSFQNDVEPIIISNCTESGCHGADGNSPTLLNYSDVMTIVTAGKPHGSQLYQVIDANSSFNIMPKPPNPPLTDVQIKTIYVWIAQGAQDN